MSSEENLSKKERLIKTKDFRSVYRDGRSFKKDFLLLKILPSSLTENRVGFSISAKHVKKAYRRNRIRRLLREAYRKNKQALKKSFDIVFVVRRNAGEQFGYKDAEKLLLALANEAGILLCDIS